MDDRKQNQTLKTRTVTEIRRRAAVAGHPAPAVHRIFGPGPSIFLLLLNTLIVAKVAITKASSNDNRSSGNITNYIHC